MMDQTLGLQSSLTILDLRWGMAHLPEASHSISAHPIADTSVAVPPGTAPVSASAQGARVKSRRWRWLRAFGKNGFNVVVVIAVPLLFHSCVYDIQYVPSTSMAPTLLEGDRVVVATYAYGYDRFSFPFGMAPFAGRIFPKTPARGDIVSFKKPGGSLYDYVKRVIGLPGDTVQVIGGRVYINGDKLPVAPLPPLHTDGPDSIDLPLFQEDLPGHPHPILKMPGEQMLDNTVAFHVPEGHLFVMGDNRDNSSDSRVLLGVALLSMDRLEGHVVGIASSRAPMHPWAQWWHWGSDIRWNRIFTRPS